MIELPKNKRERRDFLREYMKKERLRVTAAARVFGVSHTTIRKWLNPDDKKEWGREPRSHAERNAAARKHYAKKASTLEGRIEIVLSSQRCWAKKNGVKPCTTPIEDIAAAYRETCPLCDIGGKKMVIDHNHETGEFRGWICRQCNLVLGLIHDNPETLEKLKAYLS